MILASSNGPVEFPVLTFLVLLPAVAWQQPFVPTLEGQYIIKNLAIIAVAISIVSQMAHPEDSPDRSV